MELTIVQPIKVRMPDGPQAFEPGQVITLPDTVAHKLMALAPGKVRPRLDSNHLHPGVWVEFNSPLFGMCTAQVQGVTLEGCIITNHSVVKDECGPVTIPASWVHHIYREQP